MFFNEKMIQVYVIKPASREHIAYFWNKPSVGETIKLDKETWRIDEVIHDLDYLSSDSDVETLAVKVSKVV